MDTSGPVELSITGVATGGEGVARAADGRVVFVGGALPGEVVTAAIDEVRRRHARGRVIEVHEASADRVAPDCEHVARGCGGCDWRHVHRVAQRRFRADVVRDVLTRLGGVAAPDVRVGPVGGTEGRTTIRAGVEDGRLGFRRRRSHDVLDVAGCPAAHPALRELLTTARFDGTGQVTMRTSVLTGDTMVRCDGPVPVALPEGIRVVTGDDPQPSEEWLTERVGDADFRVGIGSFFQSSPSGAAALAATVQAGIADAADGPLLDLFGGVGLLGRLCAGGRQVTIVESNRSSAADARINVPHAEVVRSRVERWSPTAAAVAIADPARSGLGAAAVEVVGASGAERLVLVSCDAGALGRDAGLLIDDGWGFSHATTVEMFPGTSHVEVVSVFSR